MNKSPERVTRDAEKVISEYDDDKWKRILESIASVLDRGWTTLAPVLSQVDRIARQNPDETEHSFIAFGRLVRLPDAAAWEAYNNTVAELVHIACKADTEGIVELGSGSGRNLLWLWLRGGPKEATYYACEFTKNGRLSYERFAALDKTLNAKSLRFDFNNPDFEGIKYCRKHMLVFTCTAIEQIPYIKPEVFTKLFSLSERLTCVHFEPVGWQMREDLGCPDGLGSSRVYARDNDYNRNLWPVLKQFEKEGRIRIEKAYPDFLGYKVENSLSFIRWSKV